MLVSLGKAARIWAVPSVFGAATALRRLHQALEPELDAGDRLVYLGNYMGYGDGVIDTLDELLAFRQRLLARPGWPAEHVVALRGAQEEMWVKLLQIQWAMLPEEAFAWMMAHGVGSTLRAYGGDPDEAGAKFRAGVVVTTRWTTELRERFNAQPGHYDFVHGLASAAYTEDRALLFLNAGLDPAKPLDMQNDLFWWSTPAFEALQAPYAGFQRVVRGYDAERRGLRLDGPVVSIDAGCGFGGPLVAVCFAADGSVAGQLEVPSETPPGGRSSGWRPLRGGSAG